MARGEEGTANCPALDGQVGGEASTKSHEHHCLDTCEVLDHTVNPEIVYLLEMPVSSCGVVLCHEMFVKPKEHQEPIQCSHTRVSIRSLSLGSPPTRPRHSKKAR